MPSSPTATTVPCAGCKANVTLLLNSAGDPVYPKRCDTCGLNPAPVEEPAPAADDKPAKKVNTQGRRRAPRDTPLSTATTGSLALGVDPGYRYVGVVARDNDTVVHATTLVRPEHVEDPFEWAALVCDEVREIVHALGPIAHLGVEGVAAPKGFKGGQRASLNPKFILFTGVVAGAVYRDFKDLDAIVIPPGSNGSQHVSHYPNELVGRRPATLPGSSNKAGTRAHEQSAYDVAGKARELALNPTG